MISRFKYISSEDTRVRMEKFGFQFKISKTLSCKVTLIILSFTGFVILNKPWNFLFSLDFLAKKKKKNTQKQWR